jgi:hypothetical protein
MSPPMRWALGAFASALLSSAVCAECSAIKDHDTSILLLNFKGPLVSEQLAERIAWDFFQVRYGNSGLFEPRRPAEILDLDDRWGVTFDNNLLDSSVDSTTRIQPKRMGIEICKSDGAILRLR